MLHSSNKIKILKAFLDEHVYIVLGLCVSKNELSNVFILFKGNTSR